MADKKISIGRREFLRLAGMATAGATAFTANSCAPAKTNQETGLNLHAPIKFTKETDVIIIGTGGAGLWAAYETTKAGIKTVIVEKEPRFGGDTVLACGVFPIVGTKALKNAGMASPTPEEAYNQFYDLLFSKRRVPELGKAVMVYGAKCIDIWTEQFGIEWMPFPDSKGTERFFHIPQPGLGNLRHLFTPLFKHVKKAGAEFMFETKMLSFIVDKNKTPVGVRVQDVNTLTYTDIKAKKILLATGDFVANQEMIARFLPSWSTIPCITYTSMGEGIQMALPLGASLERMDDPVNFTAENPNIVVWGGYESIIHVDPKGKRFVKETDMHHVAVALVDNGFYHWYAIFDEQTAKGYNAHSIKKISKLGIISKADQIEDLADKIGVPPSNLSETLKHYNQMMEAGKDTQFNRKRHLRPLNPPFYAAFTRAVRYKTNGGLQINQHCQVIDVTGMPIHDLYAAGSVTGSTTPNVMDACGIGMLAGEVMVKHLKGQEPT